jgi:NADH-quinone oxidoreductase subunit G
VKRVIARDNPDVDDGWLCDRGRYGFEMFAAPERIDGPRLRGGAAASWEEATRAAAEGLRAAGPGKVAALVGDASNEEAYLVQRLLREALGSPHVDSRPADGPDRDAIVALSQPSVSAKVSDIDGADAILVLGTDPLHSSPILDLRVRKAIRRNGAKLVVATERPTALDGGAEAIARYAPGEAAHFIDQLGKAVGGEENVATPLAESLRDAEKVVVLWGERIGSFGSGQLLNLAGALKLAEVEGAGLLEIPDFANARGLREAGCLPDARPGLAESMETGKSTEQIRDALESGELTGLVLFGLDPIRDFPDTAAWEAAITAADFVVCFSMHETATSAKADVLFPLETHAEKDGTVTHPDGRLQRIRPSASRPGDIRPNHAVLADLSAALGHDTGVNSQPTAFAALTQAVPFYSDISDADIGGRGIRWQQSPSGANVPKPQERSAPGSPDTVREAPSPPSEATPESRRVASADPGADRSLALGTYRDLWAGPITELNPPLKFLTPRQRLEVSSADAELLGLKSGEEVRVNQNGTAVTAQVQIKERVPEGVCFLAEGVMEGNANALRNGGPVRVQIEKLSEVPA